MHNPSLSRRRSFVSKNWFRFEAAFCDNQSTARPGRHAAFRRLDLLGRFLVVTVVVVVVGDVLRCG